MSSVDAPSDRHSAADTVAGFLAVGSLFLSAIALGAGLILQIEARPARTSIVAALLALVAARLSARYQKLAEIAKDDDSESIRQLASNALRRP